MVVATRAVAVVAAQRYRVQRRAVEGAKRPRRSSAATRWLARSLTVERGPEPSIDLTLDAGLGNRCDRQMISRFGEPRVDPPLVFQLRRANGSTVMRAKRPPAVTRRTRLARVQLSEQASMRMTSSWKVASAQTPSV
jgi:hypothetical protein